MRSRRCAAALILLLLVGCSSRPTEPVRGTPMRGVQEGPNPGAPEEKPFVEADVAPPAYPEDAALVEFRLRGLTDNRFYIDRRSLSVGPDRVVRFVLVIRTPDGVSNARFSGLRCSDGEWKDYAFGKSDRTWATDRDAHWRPIQIVTYNDYQRTLYQDYFCVGGVLSSEPAGDTRKLVKLLESPPWKDPRVPR
jgi:CNP1-like family